MSQDHSALGALLARVEAATGPDRALDRALALAFGWTVFDDGMGVMTRMRNPDGVIGAHNAPPFTASLDAALSLVERVLPGFYWDVARGMKLEADTGGPYWACCYSLNPHVGWDDDGEASQHPGSTPALALLAAMLKALAASTAGPIGGQSHRLDASKLPSTESEGR